MSTHRRILGLTFDGRPIFEPPEANLSITLAAAGGGKTPAVSMPAVPPFVADTGPAPFIDDVKNGEIAAQTRSALARFGRRVVILDDLQVFGAPRAQRRSSKAPDTPRSTRGISAVRLDKETRS